MKYYVSGTITGQCLNYDKNEAVSMGPIASRIIRIIDGILIGLEAALNFGKGSLGWHKIAGTHAMDPMGTTMGNPNNAHL